MALTDIVSDQQNSSVAARGDTGAVSCVLADEGAEVLRRSGVMQRWDASTSSWVTIPLRYYTSEGWV